MFVCFLMMRTCFCCSRQIMFKCVWIFWISFGRIQMRLVLRCKTNTIFILTNGKQFENVTRHVCVKGSSNAGDEWIHVHWCSLGLCFSWFWTVNRASDEISFLTSWLITCYLHFFSSWKLFTTSWFSFWTLLIWYLSQHKLIMRAPAIDCLENLLQHMLAYCKELRNVTKYWSVLAVWNRWFSLVTGINIAASKDLRLNFSQQVKFCWSIYYFIMLLIHTYLASLIMNLLPCGITLSLESQNRANIEYWYLGKIQVGYASSEGIFVGSERFD